MRKAHFGEQETICFPAIPGVLAVTPCAQPALHATSAVGTEDIALAHLLTQALPQLPRAVLGCYRTKSATFSLRHE